MTLSGYDRWLTNDPREWSASKEDAFERFCEDNDLDPEAGESVDEFEDWVEGMAEEAMERARDAREDARLDREYDRD